MDLELTRLRGTIPPEIGRLSNLEYLNLSRNAVDAGTLGGPIPNEIGNLTSLLNLNLNENELTGAVPNEIGDLTNLQTLDLSQNALTGPVPVAIGNLTSLLDLNLSQNILKGPIPEAIGNLGNLHTLNLSDNHFEGTIPVEISKLSELQHLWLERLGLEGPVPKQLGILENLSELRLTGNAEMSGALPTELTNLPRLEVLLAGGTTLCAPEEGQFLTWLRGLPKRRIRSCLQQVEDAYLVQAIQSRDFPVPLVAGEPALLRVFVTAQVPNEAGIPPVRAVFFSNGSETYTVTIPPKPGPIPTAVYEGSLPYSANIEIPGWVVAQGLELVIEIDPEGTLDRGLGVARRIPESGRMAIDVQAVPLLDLTLVPFIVTTDPDHSIVDLTQEMAADPENHEVLWPIRELMPVADLEVTAHAPVETSTDDSHELLRQTDLIRVAEGGTGHYMGMLPYFVEGTAYLGARSSFAPTSTPRLMAHEIGHNFNLLHAPCPRGINRPDPSFPHPGGIIGAWGYDFRNGGRLVDPSTSDVMGYCGYEWPSDYHFTNALSYRLFNESSRNPASLVAGNKSLVVWGGVNAEGDLFLEPAFVMDAPPALPDSVGGYKLVGRIAAGAELFSLPFSMPTLAHGDGASSSFVFALPIKPDWAGNLASITLSGPGGSATLDGESNLPMSILRNPRTGQVRSILRDPPLETRVPAEGTARVPADDEEADFEVLFSRGIPDTTAWRL